MEFLANTWKWSIPSRKSKPFAVSGDSGYSGGGSSYSVGETAEAAVMGAELGQIDPLEKGIKAKVLDTYVVPKGTPELKEYWAKRYGNSFRVIMDEN